MFVHFVYVNDSVCVHVVVSVHVSVGFQVLCTSKHGIIVI